MKPHYHANLIKMSMSKDLGVKFALFGIFSEVTKSLQLQQFLINIIMIHISNFLKVLPHLKFSCACNQNFMDNMAINVDCAYICMV